MKRVLSAVIIAVLAAGGVAAAQEGPKVVGDLTRAEAKAKAIDTFEKLDLNHDGKLDAADRAVHTQQMFDRLDTDHDGQISRAEFAAAHQRGPHGHAGPDGHGGSGGSPPAPGGKPGEHKWSHRRGMHRDPMMMRMARDADTDHDGAVSKDEFVVAALKRFDAQDTNHDGRLTQAERQAAHKAMRDDWRAKHGRDHGRDHERGRGQGDVPPPPPPAG